MLGIISQCKSLLIYLFFIVTVAQSNVTFDQQKPNDMSGKKWSSLKAIVQETKLLPTPDGIDGQREDEFGISVSLKGDTAVIGASGNAGTNGFSSGSVYVFKIDGSNNWIQTAKLQALDGAASDRFGGSVSLSGNRLLVGSTGDDDNGSSSGSAYFFEFNGTTWSETEKITASDAGANDNFGWSVELKGTRAVISAPFTDDGQTNSGSIYVYEYDGTDWLEKQILKPNDVSHLKQFGHSLSLDNNRLLVGANRENSHTGSAYIFDFTLLH